MNIIQTFGTIAYWLTWPGIWLILRWSKRTRLIATSNNSILVVKPWLGNGKWCLPGGGIHANEGELSAVEREVFEETGIQLTKNRIKRLKNLEYRQDGLRFAYTLYSYNLTQPIATNTSKPEIIAIDWIERNKLNAHNANHDVLTALKHL